MSVAKMMDWSDMKLVQELKKLGIKRDLKSRTKRGDILVVLMTRPIILEVLKERNMNMMEFIDLMAEYTEFKEFA